MSGGSIATALEGTERADAVESVYVGRWGTAEEAVAGWNKAGEWIAWGSNPTLRSAPIAAEEGMGGAVVCGHNRLPARMSGGRGSGGGCGLEANRMEFWWEHISRSWSCAFETWIPCSICLRSCMIIWALCCRDSFSLLTFAYKLQNLAP